jgi:hypothetical protein
MQVSDSGEKVVDQFRDPRPGHAILLTASPERASPSGFTRDADPFAKKAM